MSFGGRVTENDEGREPSSVCAGVAVNKPLYMLYTWHIYNPHKQATSTAWSTRTVRYSELLPFPAAVAFR